MLSIALEVELLILREVLVVFRLSFENLPIRDHLGQQLRDQHEVHWLLKKRHFSKLGWDEFSLIHWRVEQERDFSTEKLARQIKSDTVL